MSLLEHIRRASLFTTPHSEGGPIAWDNNPFGEPTSPLVSSLSSHLVEGNLKSENVDGSVGVEEKDICQERGIKSILPGLTPRPVIACMLNNKGALHMERCQYAEARKSLDRALRLVETDTKRCNSAASSEEDVSKKCSQGKHFKSVRSGSGTPNQRIERSVPDVLIVTTTSSLLSDLLGSEDDSDSADSASSNFIQPSKPPSEYDEGMDPFKKPFRLNASFLRGHLPSPPLFSRSIDGTILFNLGRVYHNEGSHDDALDMYKLALQAIERRDNAREEQLALSI
jgi:tetratricopeptide (TPR) repeat protein